MTPHCFLKHPLSSLFCTSTTFWNTFIIPGIWPAPSGQGLCQAYLHIPLRFTVPITQKLQYIFVERIYSMRFLEKWYHPQEMRWGVSSLSNTLQGVKAQEGQCNTNAHLLYERSYHQVCCSRLIPRCWHYIFLLSHILPGKCCFALCQEKALLTMSSLNRKLLLSQKL